MIAEPKVYGVHTLLTETVHDALRQYAKDNGIGMSEYLRSLIIKDLSERGVIGTKELLKVLAG